VPLFVLVLGIALCSVAAQSEYSGLIFVAACVCTIAVLGFVAATGWGDIGTDLRLLDDALRHYIVVYNIILIGCVCVGCVINVHYFALHPVQAHGIKHFKHNAVFKHD
jgi:hypothetical protein